MLWSFEKTASESLLCVCEREMQNRLFTTDGIHFAALNLEQCCPYWSKGSRMSFLICLAFGACVKRMHAKKSREACRLIFSMEKKSWNLRSSIVFDNVLHGHLVRALITATGSAWISLSQGGCCCGIDTVSAQIMRCFTQQIWLLLLLRNGSEASSHLNVFGHFGRNGRDFAIVRWGGHHSISRIGLQGRQGTVDTGDLVAECWRTGA